MKKTLKLTLLILGGWNFQVSAQLGMGLTNPNSKFDIRGTISSPASSGSSLNSILRISNSLNSGSAVLDAGIWGGNYAWLQSRQSSNYANNLPLYINRNGGAVSINTSNSSAALNVGGTILASGVIRSTTAGQELNRIAVNETDLGKSSAITNSSGTYTDVITYVYTPVSDKSRILISFNSNYSIGGNVSAGTDEFNSQITVGGTTIQEKRQLFVSSGGNPPAGGSGFRGSAVFPITGVYKNSSTNNITIKVRVSRTSGDDTITINPDILFTIVEIAD